MKQTIKLTRLVGKWISSKPKRSQYQLPVRKYNKLKRNVNGLWRDLHKIKESTESLIHGPPSLIIKLGIFTTNTFRAPLKVSLSITKLQILLLCSPGHRFKSRDIMILLNKDMNWQIFPLMLYRYVQYKQMGWAVFG